MLSHDDLIILGRAALAALLGAAIGWEREVTAGSIRALTIGLSTLTAATLTALGEQIFAEGADRIVQGIVTGVGFLGAGVILHRTGGEVHGLATAASMWAMTAVGIAVGSGRELLGVLLAALIYLANALGKWPVLVSRRKAAPQERGSISPGRQDLSNHGSSGP